MMNHVSKRISLKDICIVGLIIATISPSFIFVAGYKVNTYLYLLCGILFLFSIIANKERLQSKVAVFYLIGLVVYAVQALFDTSVMVFIDWFFATFIVVIAVTMFTDSEKYFKWIINGLLYISLPILLLGIFECISTINIFQKIAPSWASFYHEYRLGIFRISGIGGHPIVYCSYLTILSALAIYRLSWKDSKNRKIVRLIYFLVIVNAVLTVSRSIWIILIAEQIVLLYKRKLKILNTKAVIGILAVLVTLLVSELVDLGLLKRFKDFINMLLQVFGFGSGTYSAEFSSSGYSGVSGDRNLLYNWVTGSLAGNEVWGKGTYADFTYMATKYRAKTSIENYYLSTLYRHGYFGLIIMALGLLSLIIYCIKSNSKKDIIQQRLECENNLSFSFVSLIVVTGYIISFFMVDQAAEARLFYVFVGLTFAYNKIRRKPDNKYEIKL